MLIIKHLKKHQNISVMPKTLLLSLFLTIIVLSGFAQVPAAFNYQAVVRNNSGDIVANQNVSFQISMLQNSVNGAASYVETQSGSTNGFGLVSLKIGTGTIVSGSFNPANWGSSDHFMKVEVDVNGGSSYIHLGTTQLLAVPYAFHAQTVENDKVNDADADASNELQTINLSGTELSLSNGGGTVTLPSSGSGGDNWGTQSVVSDVTLAGNGTTASPLGINDELIDNQTLSVSGYDLTISEGNTVRLPTPNNEIWTNATLQGTGSLENPLMVNHENVDKQTLSLSENDLTISNGNTITLPISENLWQTENSNLYYKKGEVGIGTDNPEYTLDIQDAKPAIRIKAIPSTRDAGNAYLILDKLNRNKQSSIIYRSGGDSYFHAGLLGNDYYSISTSPLSLNGLQVDTSGDVKISDELHTTKTGEANMVPIAYGTIETNGEILVSSGNISVTTATDKIGKYYITIADEPFSFDNYIANATIVEGRRFVTLDSESNKLVVYTSDYDRMDLRNSRFSFVVYKP